MVLSGNGRRRASAKVRTSTTLFNTICDQTLCILRMRVAKYITQQSSTSSNLYKVDFNDTWNIDTFPKMLMLSANND